jgi:type IV fimbrial biogenesis protein FimT
MTAGRSIRGGARGFTLLEILIVVAIAAISLSLAAPNLAYARANAIATGKNTVVQPLIANAWTGGWMTYTDLNADGNYQPTDILLKQTAPTIGQLKICTTAGNTLSTEFQTNIQYRPDGSVVRTTAVTSKDGLTVSDNSAATGPAKIRSLYFGPSGRVSIVIENTDYNLTVAGVPCP